MRPTTTLGDKGYAALMADPGRAVLAFDFDGVLAPIVDNPELAFAHPPAITALRRLAVRVGTLAVITGRPADLVVKLGRFGDFPELAGLVVFGHYGRERWDSSTGEVVAPPLEPGVPALRVELPVELARLGLLDDVWVEDKVSALAVHTRRSPDPAAAFAALREPLVALADRHGLVVEPGRLVIEMRPAGFDKGGALRLLVDEREASSVVYAGDDLGDLSAFAAVDAMRELGTPGVKVCSGSTEVVELARQADVVVDGPPGVAVFLDQVADQLGADPSEGSR